MRLVSGDPVTWTHHARIKTAAGAVIVAHLDGTEHAAHRTGIVRPIKLRDEIANRSVAGAVAKQGTVIHPRRTGDPIWVHQPDWIEGVLNRLERADDSGAEHLFMEFAAHQTVAMLAAMGTFVLPDQGECFLGNGSHCRHVRRILHVKHWPYMKTSDGGVRVPCPFRAMPLEDVVKPFSVVRKVFEIDRAVLDKGD